MKKKTYSILLSVLVLISSNVTFGQSFLYRLGDRADSLRKIENYSASIRIYKQVIQLCDSTSEDFLKYKIRLGISYFLNNESSNATEQYKTVLAKTALDTLNIYRAHAFNNIGLVQDNYGDYKSSIDNYLKAQILYGFLSDSLMYDVTRMNIGIIYKKQGKYVKALEKLTASATGFENRGNSSQLAQVYSSIGGIQELMGNFSKATDFYRKALSIRESLRDWSGIASVYNNIGGIYKLQGALDSAILYFNQAIAIMKNTNSRNLGITFHNVATCFNKDGQTLKARKYFQKAIAFKIEIGDTNEIAITQNEYAKFEIKERRLKTAFDILNKATYFVSRSKSNRIKKNNADVWKQYYKTIGEADSALYYFELSENLQKEINNKEYLTELAQLQETFESNSKDRTIRSLTKSNHLNKEKLTLLNRIISQLKLNINYILFGLGFILLLGVIFFYVQKQRVRHHKLKAKFNGVEEEKKRISMELHDAVGSSLKKIKYKMTDLVKSNNKEISVNEILPVVKELDHISNEIVMISHSLYHPDIEKYVFSEILQDMIFDWFEGSEEKFINKMESIKILDDFKTTSKAHIYRCIQELLINIRQHAEADSVCIKISKQSNNVVLMISDNSSIKKTVKYSGNGIGIKNLKERLRIMSGHFSVRLNNSMTGTIAILDIPIAENKNND